MLQIIVKGKEFWDDTNEVFVNTKDTVLTLEHSLVSVSKWEAKYKKPFIDDVEKTEDELLYYIKCMTLTQNVDLSVYNCISKSDYEKIMDYINDTMTATWFVEKQGKGGRSGKKLTSELIYYYMFANQIPIECQKWHLNRLFTLLRIFGEENKEPQKMSKKDAISRNRALNKARRAKTGSKG